MAENSGLAQEQKKNVQRLFVAFLITFVVMLVEIVGGYLSNSLALLSDAGHMFTDALALALSLFALSFALKEPTSKRTYGFYRIEILAALFNGSILSLVAIYIFYQAYLRFLNPPPVKSLIMLSIGFLGLLANVIPALVLRGGKDNLNVKGAFLHLFYDALSSVGVIIGGVVIYFTNLNIVDPIVGAVVGIFILRGAIELVIEAANILLEAVPKEISLEEVTAGLKKIKGVKDVHDFHLWTITSKVYALSAHILIEDVLTSHSTEILKNINSLLKEEFGITHTTIQFECQVCEEGVVCRLMPENQE